MMCQANDGEVKRIKRMVEQSDAAETTEPYVLEGGILYRRHRGKMLFVMPKSMRKSLVVTAHDLIGHPAADRTVSNILQDFWFTGVRRYVRLHTRACFECLLTRVPRGKRPGLLHLIPLGKGHLKRYVWIASDRSSPLHED